MPRNFDSDEVARSFVEGMELQFVENVDCPACGTVFEGEFHDDSITVEDVVDPPVGVHRCPACGHEWSSAMTGWTFYSEAG